GMLLMSDQTFAHIFGNVPLEQVSLGLVQLKDGADADEAAGKIAALFPDTEVRVRTRLQMESQETHYWLFKTRLGVIFLLGVGVLALTLVMCAVSGLFAVRKLKYADPADLF